MTPWPVVRYRIRLNRASSYYVPGYVALPVERRSPSWPLSKAPSWREGPQGGSLAPRSVLGCSLSLSLSLSLSRSLALSLSLPLSLSLFL